jgi:hypothetical protein
LERGVLKKASFFSANNQISNATTTFVDVFNVSVPLSGTGTQCVLSQYSGEIALSGSPEGGVSGEVRTLLDGVLMEGHSAFGANFVSPDGQDIARFEVVGFHNWLCGIASGVHNVRVQIAGVSGSTIFVRGRSLTVQFKK